MSSAKKSALGRHNLNQDNTGITSAIASMRKNVKFKNIVRFGLNVLIDSVQNSGS
jgi:hypothetical protein